MVENALAIVQKSVKKSIKGRKNDQYLLYKNKT